MDTWNRLFFSHPSASVNSQLCRHYRALWLSARVMQSNQTLSSAVGGTAVWCSLHNPHLSVSWWKRTENSVPSWLLGVNSKSRSVTGVELQNSHRAKGVTVIYTGWEMLLLWKLTPAPFEIYSDLEKRPWLSLNLRVLESVWIPSPEPADLKCRLRIWAVDRCGIFHCAKSPSWGITLGHIPPHMHIPFTQTWAQHTHRSPPGIASFGKGWVVEKLGTTIKKTKCELEML